MTHNNDDSGTRGHAPREREKREDGAFRKRRPNQGPGQGSDQRPGHGPDKAAEHLIELDQDIMKLLAKRAKLVSRIRGGKDHAANPAAIRAEKEVRAAWEKNAARFSRDTKFTRQFYALMQDLQIQSREESEKLRGFSLTPPRKPVDITLPGPADTRSARLAAALAAALGKAVSLRGVLLNAPLLDLAKALGQAGAAFAWTGSWPAADPSRLHYGGRDADEPSLAFADKVIYAGEDELSLYLLAFLAAANTGKTRFTGGSALKMADLGGLRRFLPTLGARLAHTMPGSRGLPASLESSGMLPESIVIPAELPPAAVLALLCAAGGWGRTVTLDLAALPAGVTGAALGRLAPLFALFGVGTQMRGSLLTVTPPDRADHGGEAPLAAPDFTLGLDPAICAYILALPAFAGGDARLAGSWPAMLPDAETAVSTLGLASLAVNIGDARIESRAKGAAAPVFPDVAESFAAGPFTPLRHALAAFAAHNGGRVHVPSFSTTAPDSSPDSPPGASLAAATRDVAESFYAALGLASGEDGLLSPLPPTEGETPEPVIWTSPDPWWAMAFALAAYFRPRLRLANPGVVTDAVPGFWQIYNALPKPGLDTPPPKKQQENATPRRRIRAS